MNFLQLGQFRSYWAFIDEWRLLWCAERARLNRWWKRSSFSPRLFIWKSRWSTSVLAVFFVFLLYAELFYCLNFAFAARVLRFFPIKIQTRSGRGIPTREWWLRILEDSFVSGRGLIQNVTRRCRHCWVGSAQTLVAFVDCWCLGAVKSLLKDSVTSHARNQLAFY